MCFLHLPFRLSFVSTVFDCNAPFNDVTPLSPILFPVDLTRMKKR